VTLHPETFNSVNPTDAQKSNMQHVSDAAAQYAAVLDHLLPDGPDKSYLLRKLREVAMWANVALTRHPDGTPRG
jgi:hypothetical protein